MAGHEFMITFVRGQITLSVEFSNKLDGHKATFLLQRALSEINMTKTKQIVI